MLKQVLQVVLLQLILSFFSVTLVAQEVKENKDSVALPKKKGLFGEIGKSLNKETQEILPVRIANPFIKYTGKTIRKIDIVRLGFERNIYDTTIIKNNYGVIIANGIHKKTKIKVTYNNLFFKSGDQVQPYLLADNERYLRDQIYLQDARILIDSIPGIHDSVDVKVITKDIFPISAALIIGNSSKMTLLIRDENVAGSGSRLFFGTLYDKVRNPQWGYGVEYLKRNLLGSFVDWGAIYRTYNGAINSGRGEETYLYTHFDRPLVTPFIPWIGGAAFAYRKSNNNYLTDSLYKSDYKYTSHFADVWFGYNLSNKILLYKNSGKMISKFIAVRGFYQKFSDLPDINHELYDYLYANIRGVLASYNIFKQEAYRANFIYGFGRNEDLAEGFGASLIGGWAVKEGRSRPYFGAQALRSHFSSKGFYTSYIFRVGGNLYQDRWEDIDMLFNVDHFTKLKKINSQWYNRNFFSAGFATQTRPVLDQPLHINSVFGLPYFRGMLGYS